MIREDHPLFALESQVSQVLNERGPLTGAILSEALPDASPIDLWKVCFESNLFRIINSARYYLRYDITRENQLRLSPSILRDFLTYSLVFKPDQRAQAVENSARLANKHRVISRRKMRVARQAIMSLDEDTRSALNQGACFFISGDVAYYLGHDVPRVHSEYETTIRGSDIDILVIYNHEIDISIIKDAERQFLKFKSLALRNPDIAEEIDFLFKPVSKMFGQMRYRDIHEKIASKVLYESFFLYGRIDLYERLMFELEMSGVQARIEADFETALMERKETIRQIFKLVKTGDKLDNAEIQSLFFFSQERLEFQ